MERYYAQQVSTFTFASVLSIEKRKSKDFGLKKQGRLLGHTHPYFLAF